MSETYSRQQKRANLNRIRLCKVWNSKCSRCHYDRNAAALEFCPVEGKTLDFPMNERDLANRSLESLAVQVKKCRLLCKNCVADLANPNLRKKT